MYLSHTGTLDADKHTTSAQKIHIGPQHPFHLFK